MAIFSWIPAVALVLAASLGLGAAALRLLGIGSGLSRSLHASLAFAVGHGLLGWTVFYIGTAGTFSQPVLLVLCFGSLVGMAFLPRPRIVCPTFSPGELLTIGLLGVVFACGVVQALAPPTDADSLAYHFALPRDFLNRGRIEFVPRAVDGAIPLLVQMTYLPALAIGGEQAMTMWALLSSWGTPALLYAISRPHLGRAWSLGAALLMATLPAFVYGAPSGQIEAKVAMYVMACGWAVGQAPSAGWRHAALAGIAAGLFAGSKYTGLLLVGSAGLILLLFGRCRLGLAVAYGVFAVVAGGQWYWWNWVHTGDPLFPMLHEVLSMADGPYWNSDHHAYFVKGMFGAEVERPRTVGWMLLYPFEATLAALPKYEATRTGFGPFPVMALPFALAGAWACRRRLLRSPLTNGFAIAVLFYAVFYLLGISQRVRHLLPVLPLALIPMLVAMRRAQEAFRPLSGPIVGTLVLTVAIQLAGSTLFTASFARFMFSSQTGEEFIARMVPRSDPVHWINNHLGPSDKLLYDARQLAYLLKVPAVMAHAVDFAMVDLTPRARDPGAFLSQLRALGVTHLLVFEYEIETLAKSPQEDPMGRLAGPLAASGCLKGVKTFSVSQFGSRTLRGEARSLPATLLALDPPACPAE